MIYLAPLQGFTNFIYRNAWYDSFQGIEKFFMPYISLQHGKLGNSQKADILPENNPHRNVIPQVLAKDSDEMQYLAEVLFNYGYREINLNLGCPYPMATNRGRGAGLLPHPERLHGILEKFFTQPEVKLSVKLRAGLDSPDEIQRVIPVLNDFPLTEVIVHARTARQLYSGNIHHDAFSRALELSIHPVVYNGNLFSADDYQTVASLYPGVNAFMLGRGILMNPLLPAAIREVNLKAEEKVALLKAFHDRVYKDYLEQMDNAGNAVNKMKQFWIYFSHLFPNQHKALKVIKKARNVNEYVNEVNRQFLLFQV